MKKFDYLTRRQIQTIHGLGGDRNANRILNDMAPYLGDFRHGLEKVYHLNKQGRERIGAEVPRKKTPNIQHYLLRNQLWIRMQRPHNWQNEVKLKIDDKTILIADAQFRTKGKINVFVEVDISQPMIKNKVKLEKYKWLKEVTGDDFHLLWVTELESRRPKLNEMMQGFPGQVFTLNEIL